MELDFKKRFTFEERKKEAGGIRLKYPDRIPCILENAKNLELLDKNKFLIPGDLNMGQFLYVIRKRMKISSEKALFIFVNGKHLLPTNSILSKVYQDYKNEDEFLYFVISLENTFG